jgi:hypothetical protein
MLQDYVTKLQLNLEVVSKPHLRLNGCVAPLARDSHLIL